MKYRAWKFTYTDNGTFASPIGKLYDDFNECTIATNVFREKDILKENVLFFASIHTSYTNFNILGILPNCDC